MRFALNKQQRAALFIAAAMIVIVQFVQFDGEIPTGSGWIFSFLIAGTLVVAGLASVTPASVDRPSSPLDPIANRGVSFVRADALENAEILSSEVIERASGLANELTHGPKQWEKMLASAIQGPPELQAEFVAQFQRHIQISCMLVMLGLVAMRRSKGNKNYTTNVEYKALEKNVTTQLIAITVQIQKEGGGKVDLEVAARSLVTDREQIRAMITRYCVALQSKEPVPEAPLLAWFAQRCGFNLEGNARTAMALVDS